jgi:quinol-cytochrome oxidoreductase complex cytochrome b subunit
MNEETKDLLLKYLQAGAERIERGSAFVEAEIPLVVTEYLNWCWTSYLFGVLLGVVFLIIGPVLGYFVPKTHKKSANSIDLGAELMVACIFQTVCAIALTVAGIAVIANNTYSLIKVSVAPRVVLLEKIAEIAK